MVRKPHRGRTRVALCYPNSYRVAMGNLGFHQVYHLMNLHDDVVCERAILGPGNDSPRTIESNTPVSSFDLIAFSISYEADLPNIASMLLAAGVPLSAEDRTAADPLVLIGGVLAFLNPEPLAPFADLVFVGEGEELVPAFLDAYREHHARPRRELLDHLARVPGLYAPSLYEVTYHSDGTVANRTPLVPDLPERIARVICPDVSSNPARTRVFCEGAEFADMALVELSRGCVHGCRFCAAAYIYRPPRWVRAEAVSRALERGFEVRERAGLVSASVTDHPAFDTIRNRIRESGATHSVASLRLDEISAELLAEVRACGHKTLTLAPEAATERLRVAINKPFTDGQIERAAELVGASGLPALKLYFQIGLPGETDEDVEALGPMLRNIKASLARGAGKRAWPGRLTAAVNPFVPKPSTPFQWAAMARPEVLNKRIELARRSVRDLAGVRLSAGSVREALLQGAIARGDRRTGEVIARAVGKGRSALAEIKKPGAGFPGIDWYLFRERPEDEVFAWDFIDHRVDKAVLRREYERAPAGRTTPDCRPGPSCTRCRACAGEAP